MKRLLILESVLIILFISLTTPSHATVPVTCFDHSFVRGTGPPITESYTFPGIAGQATVRLWNGSSGGVERVSSGEVYINGQLIFGPHNFNQNVENLEATVTIKEGNANTIACTLKSKPGGKIKVDIVQEMEFEGAAFIGPEGGIIQVADATSPLKNVKLIIPEGAVSQPTLFTISEVQSPINLPEGTQLASIAVQIEPNGEIFQNPIFITLPYNDVDNDGYIDGTNFPEKDLPAITFDEMGNLEYLTIQNQDRDTNTITFTTYHLSTFAVIIPPSPALVYQPGPGDGVDVYISSYYYSADIERLVVGGWGDFYNSLIKFSVTTLPSSVLSAQIYLYCYKIGDYGNTKMHLDQAISFWNENTKWSNKPSTTYMKDIPGAMPDSWYSFNITSLYNSWKDGTLENYGIQLRPFLNSNNYNFFYSSDYIDDPSLRPKLVLLPSLFEEIYAFDRMWPELLSPWYFNWPCYASVDKNDHVYISGGFADQIPIFDTQGNLISKLNIKKFQEYRLSDPGAISIGPSGYIYIVVWDGSYNSILKINNFGVILNKFGSYTGRFGTSAFRYPCGISLDINENIYVTDAENNRIEKLTSDGALITRWGSFGNGAGQFNDPTGIAVDRNNNFVYVLDTRNLRIQKFTLDGQYLAQWKCIDSVSYNAAVGISVDQEGYIYVRNTANYEIRKFTGTGELVTTLYSQDWGSYGVAIDNSGYIYCTHFHTNRVEKISPDGNDHWIWTSSGTAYGYFDHPSDVAVDGNGNIYVADERNARVQKFNSGGGFISSWLVPSNTRAIAIDSSNNIYVGGRVSVWKYDVDGNLITEWGSDGTGDGQFKEIIDGIAVDNDGYVYVVDFGNHRVQKFDSNGAFITKWGSQGTSNGQFILPWAIEVNNGLVYVSDSDRHNIQIFTTEGEFVKKWETQGFNAPRGIAIDKSGNVFVCNAQGNILKLTSSGQFISKFGTPGSDPGSMASPHGIAVDSIGRLFVADMNNNRIQVFTKISVNP